MTDRELLELAAKAAGIWAVAACTFGDSDVVEECKLGLWNRDQGGVWNPLTDDGDALRLAVKLNISPWISSGNVVKARFSWAREVTVTGTDWGVSDKASATRRAIVRAAAAIGSQQ